ncbi:MAG: TIGR04206 family protein [Halobacteriales archaeon]|nr:TIGR04206 family protein [Halobacteriales archaeon]
MSRSDTAGRLIGLLAVPLIVPWTILAIRAGPAIEFDLVFAWGLVNLHPPHAVSLYAYLFRYTAGLPDHLLAWPVGALLYCAALVSAGSGIVLDREDRRVTVSLLVLAGLSMLTFSFGIARRNPAIALSLPAGTLALWAVAWVGYRPTIERFFGVRPTE